MDVQRIVTEVDNKSVALLLESPLVSNMQFMGRPGSEDNVSGNVAAGWGCVTMTPGVVQLCVAALTLSPPHVLFERSARSLTPSAWNAKHAPLELPKDMAMFYSTADGFDVKWDFAVGGEA